MTERRELLREFREWREAEGLGFDPAFVPRRFSDLRDLDQRYWEAEQDAKHAARGQPRQAPPAPPRSDYVSRKHFDQMLEVIGGWVGKRISEALKASVEPLRERIRELESMPMRFCGPWLEGQEYAPRNIVSYDGSMWHANETTRARPGRTCAWTLCVKRGRDARERKDTSK
jgi:hypothetical protein